MNRRRNEERAALEARLVDAEARLAELEEAEPPPPPPVSMTIAKQLDEAHLPRDFKEACWAATA